MEFLNLRLKYQKMSNKKAVILNINNKYLQKNRYDRIL
ncbi:hypothetical protein SAMN05421664_0458 [Chryseobacterium soldanellicola]|uniref:Uncharacterized protein n=1 Tax=Chryseobacterium soldanellicola TaxID=311333 RepID=A0A1H0Y392_9FLAO|nr:hypothetical protein SAMN05421664_0458 [Chryseobacterium soldanellicola]